MEKTNDNMLTYSALAFILALVLIIIVQGWMAPDYSATTEQVKQMANSDEILLLPAEIKTMSEDGSLASSTLIDLGDEPLLGNSLQGNILHIPFASLLDKTNLKSLKKAERIILFAGDESQAMMAAQLLYSCGIENVYAVSNNVDFITRNVIKGFNPSVMESHGEKARFDYARYFKSDQSPATKSSAAGSLPGGVKVVKAAGGC